MIGIYQITCPKCLSPLDEAARQCPHCSLELPPNYFKTCDEAPPLPVVAIGFSGHGKTHLLAALLLTIEELTNFSLDVSYLPLGETTLQNMIDWRDTADRKAILPETPTPESEQIAEPLIVSVKGIYNPRTLLIYDVAGEIFHNLKDAHRHLQALKNAQTVWFVVSANDLQIDDDAEPNQKTKGRRLGDLFAAYLTAMQKLGASLEGRNAIIVLTKGDKLPGLEVGIPENDWLPGYLDGDPFSHGQKGSGTIADREYEHRLEANSERLKRMTKDIPSAGNLIKLLSDQKMQVRFCVVSALGADHNSINKLLPGRWKRQRVLDPLLWTLSLEKKRSENDSLHLVLDAASDADPVYTLGGGALLQNLWKRLVERHEVRVWLLGQSQAAVPARRPPPSAKPLQGRPRLIGPLLESLSPKSRVIVLTQGVIVDLEDFRATDWSGRLILASTSDQESVVNRWDRPHTVLVRGEQDLDLLVSQTLRMF